MPTTGARQLHGPGSRPGQALARALLDAYEATDAAQVPLDRTLVEALLTALGINLAATCRVCGGRMRHLQRRGGVFCGDACRSQHYRHRRRRAHQLWAEGTPLGTIAQLLETSPETVLGWLDTPPPGMGPRGRPRLVPRQEAPHA